MIQGLAFPFELRRRNAGRDASGVRMRTIIGGFAALAERARLDPPPAWPSDLTPLKQHQDLCALYFGMIHPTVRPAQSALVAGRIEARGGPPVHRKNASPDQGLANGVGLAEQPFHFVRIASDHYAEEDPHVLPLFWEAQAAALQIPGTAMTVSHERHPGHPSAE